MRVPSTVVSMEPVGHATTYSTWLGVLAVTDETSGRDLLTQFGKRKFHPSRYRAKIPLCRQQECPAFESHEGWGSQFVMVHAAPLFLLRRVGAFPGVLSVVRLPRSVNHVCMNRVGLLCAHAHVWKRELR